MTPTKGLASYSFFFFSLELILDDVEFELAYWGCRIWSSIVFFVLLDDFGGIWAIWVGRILRWFGHELVMVEVACLS